MRNISFQLTTQQFKERTKTVTRRLGWKNVKAGDILMACEKCQGIPKGEKIKKLGPIRVITVHIEKLSCISHEDVVLEGFPKLSKRAFVNMFCQHMLCGPDSYVTRIHFEYM